MCPNAAGDLEFRRYRPHAIRPPPGPPPLTQKRG